MACTVRPPGNGGRCIRIYPIDLANVYPPYCAGFLDSGDLCNSKAAGARTPANHTRKYDTNAEPDAATNSASLVTIRAVDPASFKA